MGRSSIVKEILDITMPNRAVASCISFAAGMIISGFFEPAIVVLGALMILCTYSSQAIFNNIRDMEGDKVNDPSRPLASGSIRVREAWLLMGLLVVIGFAIAYFASMFLLLINALYVFLGIIYSAFTKSKWYLSYSTLVTSHIVVPLTSGYLVFGAVDEKIIAIIAFIYLTEVLAFSIKDYKDVTGDKLMGMRTLPVVLSPQKAANFTFIGLSLPLLFVWLPWHFLGLSSVFLAIYLITGTLRYLSGSRLLRNPSPGVASQILNNFRYILILQMVGWCLS